MISDLRSAREFAISRHEGQERNFSGMPYATHPISVFQILSEYGEVSKDQLMAAFLHDVLEDTDTGSEELRNEFGPDVTSIVEDLTIENPSGLDKTLYLKSEMLSMPDRSLSVKLADRLHNVLDLPLAPQEFRERYASETRDIIEHIRHHRSPLNRVQSNLVSRILDVPAL